jgi:ribosomal protein S18 acetylase RimI-like enzyme
MLIRPAASSDLLDLCAVIERACRGQSARSGWTHESDLLETPRTNLANLSSILKSPTDRLLVAFSDENAPVGCVQITDLGRGASYLGLLCVDPLLQSKGAGRALITAAEKSATELFDAKAMEMTVIDKRQELIAYYERRGYARTSETRPFPTKLDPPLWLVVLAKAL